MADRGHIESRIGRLSARQYGHVTRAQLVEIGLSDRTISRWIARGRLIPVHLGVYAVSYPRPEAVAQAAAALLACGPEAVLSHETAAALWGFKPRWPERPEVTGPSRRTRPGIRHHRSKTIKRRDVRRHRGLRVTSPARTISDIAPRADAEPARPCRQRCAPARSSQGPRAQPPDETHHDPGPAHPVWVRGRLPGLRAPCRPPRAGDQRRRGRLRGRRAVPQRARDSRARQLGAPPGPERV
jgi:hypothetical protein